MMRRKPASQFKDRCKGAKLGQRRSFAFLLAEAGERQADILVWRRLAARPTLPRLRDEIDETALADRLAHAGH